MFREQMISFLQAAVVFLLLTNALSALAAVYAMRMASGVAAPVRKARSAVERKLDAILGQAG